MANRELNIILGLTVKNFERGLKRAERSLQRTARNMQSVGRDLAQSVSLPLLAAGGAAVRTFAQFDRLEKGLEAVSDVAGDGARQFNQLLQVVKDTRTTLDLRNATKGALQLQAVGFAADDAANTLRQLGIAATVSGQASEDVGEVARQLSQASAKGRILQQDLRIILERLPSLAGVIAKEFGTVTAEGIRDAGVSADEFIQRLTAAIEQNQKFQNVQGGLAKAIESFGIEVQIAANQLGKLINEAVGLESVLNAISGGLAFVVDTFGRLDKSTQQNILRFAGLAAAAGPLLIIGSKLINIFAGVLSVYRVFGKQIISLVASIQLQTATTNANAAATVASTRATKGLVGAFRALNTAQKATLIGATVAIVAALATVFVRLASQIRGAAAEQREINKIQTQGAQAAAEEQAKIEPLIGILKNETATKNEKRRALSQLQEQYPQYFGNLDLESSKVADITAAYDNFKASILAVSRARAAEAKLAELASREIELQTKNTELLTQAQEGGALAALRRIDLLAIAGGAAGVGGLELGANKITNAFARNNTELDAIAKQRESLVKIIEQSNSDLARTEGRVTAQVTGGGSGAAAGVDAGPTGPVRNTFAQDIDFSQIDRLNDKTIQARENALDWDGTARRLNETLVEQRTELGTLGEVISDNVLDEINRTRDALEQLGLKFNEVNDIVVNFGEFSTQALNQFGNAIAQGASNFADLGKTVARTAIDIIGNLIRVGVTAAISNALKNPAGIIPPLGIALAGAAGAAASGLFRTVISSITAPGLAEGGIIPPRFPNDTFPARLSSGEAVIPLNRLNQFGGGPGVITTRVSGSDLILILERAQKEQNRIV